MSKYTIGVDFGTQSGRAVLVQVSNGHIVAQAEAPYAHGLLESQLPNGTPLPRGFVLQDPMDYIRILECVVPALLLRGGVCKQDVIGITIDATACSLVAVDENWIPLCQKAEFQSDPHAYLKLWKHHPSQEAEHINHVISQRRESFIEDYGGRCHAEWMFPKILETLHHSPAVYQAAYRFMEVADWLTTLLCGQERHNSCAASYKAFWKKADGYPTTDFFAAIDPRLTNVVTHKLGGEVQSIGTRAGCLTFSGAQMLELCEGTAVCVAHTDAHVAPPAVGSTSPGEMLLIIGTSTCNMLLDTEYRAVPGICGVAADGIVPGLYAYEAGQSAVGDLLNWVVSQVGAGHTHATLTEKAATLRPGESGLVMLDWLGGNRSILSNTELTGLVMGLTLQTRPEELYRAAIEATAFGQRIILENFREHGVPVHRLCACGGISQKNPLLMQIYADVLQMPIQVSACDQIPAVGGAIFASVAAGAENGGYDDIHTATQAMHQNYDRVYVPNAANAAIYDRLYQLYRTLYFQFGRESSFMADLHAIQQQSAKE